MLSVSVCLSLCITPARNTHIMLQAPPTHSLAVFTSVVVIVSLGSLVVTVQAKLLGGRVYVRSCPSTQSNRKLKPTNHSSFFQGLCVLGYCIAPLDIAAFVACFVRIIWVRAPVALVAWAWSIWG